MRPLQHIPHLVCILLCPVFFIVALDVYQVVFGVYSVYFSFHENHQTGQDDTEKKSKNTQEDMLAKMNLLVSRDVMQHIEIGSVLKNIEKCLIINLMLLCIKF